MSKQSEPKADRRAAAHLRRRVAPRDLTGPNLTPLVLPNHDPVALAAYLYGLRRERAELHDVRLKIADGLRYGYAIFIADLLMQLGFRTSLDAF